MQMAITQANKYQVLIATAKLNLAHQFAEEEPFQHNQKLGYQGAPINYQTNPIHTYIYFFIIITCIHMYIHEVDIK